MSPRGKRLPPPQSAIQSGTLGYTPVNAVSASYFVTGCGDVLLGFRSPDLRTDRPPPRLHVQKNAQVQERLLSGSVFNGYADAFYRGLLPEVILAFPAMAALPDFLVSFAEYFEQLLSLGFILPDDKIAMTEKRHTANRLDALLPCFVLAGSGLLFSRFITGLVRYLDEIKRQHPFVDNALCLYLIGRFVRGVSDEGALSPTQEQTPWQDSDCEARALDAIDGQPFTWREPIRQFRIAGGNPATQQRIQAVMAAHGLNTSVETHTGNSVERLELASAWRRLSNVVLPAIAKREAWPDERLAQCAQQAQAGLIAIGRLRQAFGPRETLTARSNEVTEHAGLTPDDRVMLSDLDQYARVLGLSQEQQLFRELADALL